MGGHFAKWAHRGGDIMKMYRTCAVPQEAQKKALFSVGLRV